MLAWLLSGDGDIEEINVDVNGVLFLPDDQLIRVVDLIEGLMKGGGDYGLSEQ